jgi:hypothetical protein
MGDGQVQARDAIRGVVDRVAAGLEEIDNRLGDVAMVLDQEEAGLAGVVGRGVVSGHLAAAV